MTPVCEDIFKALHEGKWLKIEYKNKSEDITNYWIGIKNIDVMKRMLNVIGMHLGTYNITELNIYIDSIISTVIVDGTYCPVNADLVRDIEYNPDKYRNLFDNVANLKILSYLEICNKLDTISYCTEYELIKFLDRDTFVGDKYILKKQQFVDIVKNFSIKSQKKNNQTTNWPVCVSV